jgi:hypothetical protein
MIVEHHADLIFSPRASSLSALTARSSASKMARVNRSSSNARTRAASPGQSCAGDRGERASRRYAISVVCVI